MVKKKTTKRRSISTRWFVNSLGLVVILLLVIIVALSFAIQSYVYNGIQQILVGRSDELINVFASSSTTSDFLTVSRSYIENFPDKDEMEIMCISSDGDILVTSTGFEPDQDQQMPDYESALSSDSDFGYWIGKLDSGERVIAITSIVRTSSGSINGAIRYMVSLTQADNQITLIILGLVIIGIIVALVITLSGIYFVRSILLPVRQIGTTAKKISMGNFDARIYKSHDDEIGELIDTINAMAEELGNSEKMKNDFISSVSHELRTPLTAITGWAETLEYSRLDNDTTKKGMNVILKESKRLSGIVEELLDFSRLQSGRMNLRLMKIDLLAELDEAVFLFTERAKTETKQLIYEEVAFLAPIMADPNKLRQVFVNVLDNAIKYTPRGGEINVSTSESSISIKVIVQDSGCGILPEDLPHVKKKFYKANQHVRGSGIGLAVADEIVNLHGGKLNIDSEINAGTRVEIILPKIK